MVSMIVLLLLIFGMPFFLSIESAIVSTVMYKAFPVTELRRHISGDVNREYEEGFIEVDLDPTSPDDIRVIGTSPSRSRPASRRNSTNVSMAISPQRQDSDVGRFQRQDSDTGRFQRQGSDSGRFEQQNSSPSYSPQPSGKLIHVRVDSSQINNESPPGLGGLGGSGSRVGGSIEMMEIQNLDSPMQSNERGITPYNRFPSDVGLTTVNEKEHQSSIFGKRKLNLLDKNVPLSDSEPQ